MNPGKTLVLFYPDCIEYEVLLAAGLLHPHLPVEVATPDGADHRGSNGMRFRADRSYPDARAGDYRAILIPGGDPESVLADVALDELLRTAAARQALLGAVCAGPLLLAKAGLLRGRRFTHGYGNLHRDVLAPYWAGATFTDEMLVRDDRVVTARAQAHIDFAIELLRALDLEPEAELERKRRFYKGLG